MLWRDEDAEMTNVRKIAREFMWGERGPGLGSGLPRAIIRPQGRSLA
jgi:hypothetical protein